MLYREAGQFKTTYAADQQLFPIRQDRIAMAILLAVAFVGVPLVSVLPGAAAIDFNYWFNGVLIPFLIFSLAALGLNILTGYAGLLSLGTAAFMAVGAFAAYNFELRLPGIPMLLSFVLAGAVAALVGIVFGLPSLRIKGFYLAVATLAAQFFVVWALTKFGWFSNYSSSGVITAQKLVVFGYAVDTPVKRYLLVLTIVCVMALAAKNMVRSAIGRAWMAVRDMDVAAEVVGIPIMKTKLLAFAISSFYCGVAGALYAFAYLGTVEPAGYRRRRQHPGIVPGRRLHRAAADLSRPFGDVDRAQLRARFARGARIEPHLDHLRRADRVLPRRGAARARAPVADRQGEAQAVAVSPLSRPGLPAFAIGLYYP